MNFKTLRILIVTLAVSCLAACSTPHTLVDTPNLYAKTETLYPSETVAPSYQTASPELFYVTDRKVSETGGYEAGRSASMAFGFVNVAFGEDLSWHELTQLSGSKTREKDIPLTLSHRQEIIRFPETPLPFEQRDGQYVTEQSAAEAYDNATLILQQALRAKLEDSEDKEIIFYVHGFNTSFEDSALNLADIWHFTGRHGVPVFYSWPAAHGGLLGYFIDSESGEYSIFHLKETLRILAAIPELEKIHIIAHSRGTALVSSAVRELVIEARAAGDDPKTRLKFDNVILAAPDLDVGVVQQRLAAERLETALGQITVYMNADDEALGLSQFLVAGLSFGRLTSNDLSSQEKNNLNHIDNVAFINVEGVNSFIGHSYYRTNTGALSDIAILIKDGFKPGDQKRPLVRTEGNFWTLPNGYPYQ